MINNQCRGSDNTLHSEHIQCVHDDTAGPHVNRTTVARSIVVHRYFESFRGQVSRSATQLCTDINLHSWQPRLHIISTVTTVYYQTLQVNLHNAMLHDAINISLTTPSPNWHSSIYLCSPQYCFYVHRSFPHHYVTNCCTDTPMWRIVAEKR